MKLTIVILSVLLAALLTFVGTNMSYHPECWQIPQAHVMGGYQPSVVAAAPARVVGGMGYSSVPWNNGVVYQTNPSLYSIYDAFKIDMAKPDPIGAIRLFGPNTAIPGIKTTNKWTITLGDGSVSQYRSMNEANDMSREMFGIEFRPK